MKTLKERDSELEKLWNQFGDIPMNPDTERIEEPFLSFPVGTDREDIWHWFDERHSKGVSFLLYGVPFYEKEQEDHSPLLDFIKQEVPFRLKEIFGIPDEKITPNIVDACVDFLCEHSDVMFAYDSIDEHIREILEANDIDPDDYEA